MMISLTLKWIFTMLNANRAPERLKAVRPCKRGEKEEVWERQAHPVAPHGIAKRNIKELQRKGIKEKLQGQVRLPP